MLKLSTFNHNHYPSSVKMVAKYNLCAYFVRV